ncbi:RNA methyltransferase, TrmA family [Shewanella halifaxensis HAW-EB4]|uniref:23S rRNA (uracil(1939)-C(5))-methyltransferase RlmD n=1 Tax=Shewanella halifaxensis (strain HAW-EB4) TaxID=458817 RepID=RLMD_SHEHH|nr:23S rRNA (uracil(1939)-C(5))-methyltransferase RlmD [Shewanella halifaxensis]B0TK00.1 RecName: Full=23S rRNA (uracil(1939)-C(5))-methyltransferase RlmD; AltName: Full=23S rRNA(m5U1939)-methyltransferase [Shewanella halifaxensis HAW-EB4]ABZ75787.1 RNA methyltransferase, TrmA family [Shewanella halifaxensis HAW-EB4]
MAQFFKAKPNTSKQLSSKLSLKVTQLDHLGAGIAHHDGKIVFINGALPGETVSVQLTEQKKKFARAKLLKIDKASAQRVSPLCPHFDKCGGCDLQHLDIDAQRKHKASTLVDLVNKFAQTQAGEVCDTLSDNAWHYRRRARLATWFDKNTKHISLGFRASSSSDVVEIQSCAVLAEPLSALIPDLAFMLNQLSGKKALGHVELTQADNGNFVVLRVTKALSDKDKARLVEFANKHQVIVLLQDDDAQCEHLNGAGEQPYYGFDDNQVKLNFSPGNFIQVNAQVNQAMVSQAVEWLSPKADERVLDLFCGIGNFSLPLAKDGAEVIGVEGVQAMVEQARINAKQSGLDKVSFYHADLSADLSKEPWLGKVDKMLIDPARAGAYESMQSLKKLKPKALVYVSCNPASLARDSEVILKQGYQLKKIGLVDMFPQTHHLESMALFELKN